MAGVLTTGTGEGMAVYRFEDVRRFEAAVGQDSNFTRFTLTPVLAAEWLGLSSSAVSELIDTGGVDAVITDDGHTFLDGDELAARHAAVTQPSAGWFSRIIAG